MAKQIKLVGAPAASFSAANFINPSVLAMEALDQLDYELVAGNLMYRDRTEDFANVRGMKVGDFVNVRTVTDFTVDDFAGSINPQEISQSSTQLQVTEHFDVSIEITSKERAMNLDGLRKEVINPAMTAMAQKIDMFLFSIVNAGSRGVYTSAALLESAADIALARAQANLQQIHKMNRIGVVSNDLEATLLGTEVFTKFDTRGTPSIPSLAEANLGRLMGIDWYSSVNFDVDTKPANATFLGNILNVAGGNVDNAQGMKVLTVEPVVGTIAEGAPVKIAGAKRMYHTSAVVLAGATTIPVVEAIDENLQELDGAAVTTPEVGAITYEGVILNPGAYSFAAPPLDPAAGDKSGIASAAGLSVRMTEAYDIQTKKTYWSFDLILGAKAIDGRLAMSLASE